MNKLLSPLRSPLAIIGLIAFVDALGFAISMPLFALYAFHQFGATPSQITGVQAVYFAMAFVSGPILGRLSDRFGRRPVLIVSQLGSLMSYLVLALAPGMAWITVGRALDGITAGNFSTVQAYISDITDPRDRAKRLGMIVLAFSTGLSVGPLIGAQIAAVSSVSTVYIVGACISGCTILLSLFALKESMPPARRAEAAAQRATQTGSIWSVIARPAVLTLLIVMFLAQFAFFSFQTTFGLWAQLEVFKSAAQEMVQSYVSYALTLVGVVGVIVQLRLIGPLVQRFGERTVMQIGLVSRGLFFFALASTPLGWMMFAAAPLLAFGTGMFLPTSSALSTYAAPDRRGQIIGVAQSAGSLGSIFGPIMAGYVFEHIAHSAALYTAGGLTGLAVLVSLGLLRFKLERPPPAAAPRTA